MASFIRTWVLGCSLIRKWPIFLSCSGSRSSLLLQSGVGIFCSLYGKVGRLLLLHSAATAVYSQCWEAHKGKSLFLPFEWKTISVKYPSMTRIARLESRSSRFWILAAKSCLFCQSVHLVGPPGGPNNSACKARKKKKGAPLSNRRSIEGSQLLTSSTMPHCFLLSLGPS